jgi:hypothetical protein
MYTNIMMDRSGIKVNKLSIRIPPAVLIRLFSPILLKYSARKHSHISVIMIDERIGQVNRNIYIFVIYSNEEPYIIG